VAAAVAKTHVEAETDQAAALAAGRATAKADQAAAVAAARAEAEADKKAALVATVAAAEAYDAQTEIPVPSCDGGAGLPFQPSSHFRGQQPGYVYRIGHLGLGYYPDNDAMMAEAVRVASATRIPFPRAPHQPQWLVR